MLHDLEELVLRCRNQGAKTYIGEAVGSYRAGSYRAAIVATWIAVAFDIIDKLRELSFSGDKAAERLVEEFEAIRKAHDLTRALAFERKLLDVARDKFELISPIEHQDLSRIQEDRHRCAHPSLISDSEIFSPSAELARLHIRSAVEILLMNEPAQGRAALDGLIKEVSSRYFPDAKEDALKILEKSPLKRARPSLARNFIVVIVKTMLAATEMKEHWRFGAALAACKSLHPDVWRRTLDADLTRLFRPLVEPPQLVQGCKLLLSDPELWTFLDSGQQTRFKVFVRDLPVDYIDYIDVLLDYAPLREVAEARARRMTLRDFNAALLFIMPEALRERLIFAYSKSETFEAANAWGKLVQANAGDFTNAEVKKLIEAAGKNGQIQGSFQLRHVLHALRKTKKYLDNDFDALLKENGLEEFVAAG